MSTDEIDKFIIVNENIFSEIDSMLSQMKIPNKHIKNIRYKYIADSTKHTSIKLSMCMRMMKK